MDLVEYTDPKTYLSEAVVFGLREALKQHSNPTKAVFQGFRENQPILQQFHLLEDGASYFSCKEEQAPCAVIFCHREDIFKLSMDEVELSEQFRERTVAFFIVDFTVETLYPVVPFYAKSPKPLSEKDILKLFGKSGPMAQKISGYEPRAPQQEMVKEICRAYNQQKHLLVEAGTGTGKSYAYLIPSIYIALQTQERCLISTNTINLQEQLLQKDIPRLKEVLGLQFEAVLVKGRGNYICKRKLQDSLEQTRLLHSKEDPLTEEVQKISEWSQTAEEGSLSELNFVPSNEAWDLVKSETDMCLRQQCVFHATCFYYQSRRKAARAHLLIANHHLLFADISLRDKTKQGVLPSYSRIVLDEAHNLEDVATAYFGLQSSKRAILQLFNRIFTVKSKRNRGILPRIQLELRKYHDEYSLNTDEFLEKVRQHHTATSDQMVEEFDTLAECLMPLEIREGFLRITEQLRTQNEFQEIQAQGRVMVDAIDDYIYLLDELRKRIKRIFSEETKEELGILTELEGYLQRLNDQARVISLCLLQNSEHEVRWIEFKQNRAGFSCVFHLSPLQIAPLLKEKLFDTAKSVILTSATLSSEKHFKFLKSRIGLDLIPASQLNESILPSPFDYQKQCLLGIPTDGYFPNDPGYDQQVSQFAEQLIRALGGRIFLLFTSFRSMNWVYEELQKTFQNKILLLKQGLFSRSQLLATFKETPNSVLLGVDSFWEGVDVPGEALSVVVLAKIPFQVPSEPVIQARIEDLEKRGINAFYHFTLPQAIIKLKQGFGRLIRTTTDRGVVYILDRRLLTKDYGKQFLASLPPAQTHFVSHSALLDALPTFFEEIYGRSQSF